ncbi:type-F conjugative transfer system protein TrbI [Pantoea cypripedii]|uniref:type-F conjugative transfer system protein TrbI n=1 Tax=Pantoea cypripedii TaxID=55209 RepID=UPI002FCBACBF
MQEENRQTADMGAGVIGTPKPTFLRSRWFRTVSSVVLIAGLSAVISVLVVQSSQRDPVVFDMKGTIDAFKQQTAQTALSKEAADTLTTRFSAALNSSLTGWQEKHGSIILVKGAVVSGMPDITPEIQADIARQMQGAP